MPATYRPFATTVTAVQELTPHLRRVTLTGPDLDQVHPLTLDRRIKLVLPRRAGDPVGLPGDDGWYAAWLALPDETRPALRTYTLRRVRQQDAEIDVDLVLHDDAGPAGSWAAQAAPGDPLLVVAPVDLPEAERVGIAWHPGPARQVLLAGDETALPAIASIVESLEPGTTGQVLVEVPTAQDVMDLRAPDGVQVTMLAREGRPHGEALEEAVRHTGWSPVEGDESQQAVEVPDGLEDLLWDEPQEVTAHHYAWLAGERSVIQRLRRHLVGERGWPRDRVAFMGYWRDGAPEC